MKFKHFVLAVLLISSSVIGTAIAAPEVGFTIVGDSTIPRSNPLEVTITGIIIIDGVRTTIPSTDVTISDVQPYDFGANLSRIEAAKVSEIEITVSSNGTRIPSCTATIAGTGTCGDRGTITSNDSETVTIARSGRNLTCTIT